MPSTSINPTVMGKAYEYACVKALKELLESIRPIEIIENSSLTVAHDRYNEIPKTEQDKMIKSAIAGIKTIMEMEPKIEEDGNDKLTISLQPDNVAISGDVRDILIIRRSIEWEIGISVKHNHAALKHSRLSKTIDFGKEWLDIDCNKNYFNEIAPIFDNLLLLKEKHKKWSEISNKSDTVYLPILNAFMRELNSLYEKHKNIVAEKLVIYLIGSNGKDYYKIIHRNNNKVKIQPFNIYGTLNKKATNKEPSIKYRKIKFPTKIIDLSLKENSKTTVVLTMDNGWAITFRIHNAESNVVPSLKFDIQLLGQPADLYYKEVDW
jgi:hypothetical protein